MKLLNLWPHTHEAPHPKKQLMLELLFAGLLVLVVMLAANLWLRWQQMHTTEALTLLQTDLQTRQQAKQGSSVAEREIPSRIRQRAAGQLDWMGQLPQWLIDGRVRWVSARMEGDSVQLEGIAKDAQAVNEVVGKARAAFSQPTIGVSEIEGVRFDGATWWRFRLVLRVLENPVSVNGVGAPTLAPDSNQGGVR